MTYPQELRSVAERVIWFEKAEESLRYPNRFLTYLMTYGTLEDILTAKKYFSDADFQATLLEPAPGIFDPHSWSYWNIVYNRVPVPPLPQRKLP